MTADMSVTLDGYGSGRGQSRERPFGDLDHLELHSWQFDHLAENTAEREAVTEAGAFIMGRRMFDAGEGEWDLEWQGWWGPDPPYHAPTFILCHRPRPSIEMEGGTVFHFVTDGIEAALELAREAAAERTVSIAGGPATLNQYLAADLVDELRLHVAPMLAGGGERLFEGVEQFNLRPIHSRATPYVAHLVFGR